jgi:hypothetical protein
MSPVSQKDMLCDYTCWLRPKILPNCRAGVSLCQSPRDRLGGTHAIKMTYADHFKHLRMQLTDAVLILSIHGFHCHAI